MVATAITVATAIMVMMMTRTLDNPNREKQRDAVMSCSHKITFLLYNYSESTMVCTCLAALQWHNDIAKYTYLSSSAGTADQMQSTSKCYSINGIQWYHK